MTGKCHRCNIMKIRFTVWAVPPQHKVDGWLTPRGVKGSNMFFDKLAAASDTKSSKRIPRALPTLSTPSHPHSIIFFFSTSGSTLASLVYIYATHTHIVYIFFISQIWISNFSLFRPLSLSTSSPHVTPIQTIL